MGDHYGFGVRNFQTSKNRPNPPPNHTWNCFIRQNNLFAVHLNNSEAITDLFGRNLRGTEPELGFSIGGRDTPIFENFWSRRLRHRKSSPFWVFFHEYWGGGKSCFRPPPLERDWGGGGCPSPPPPEHRLWEGGQIDPRQTSPNFGTLNLIYIYIYIYIYIPISKEIQPNASCSWGWNMVH